MHEFAATSINQPSAGKTGICTLFEGDYHLGLAAFLNSLVCSGYKGTVWAGFRGQLPPWVHQLTLQDGQSPGYMVANQIRLVFVPLQPELHFANYKPQFMLDLFSGHARHCEYLWYFDPDIFLRCSWTFFEKWQRRGIALCEDISLHHLSEDDPVRWEWMDLGAEMGLSKPRALNRYFNSGMMGVPTAHAGVLALWKKALDGFASKGQNLNKFGPGVNDVRSNPDLRYATDQDALNMALMYTDAPLSAMGPDAMGFIPGEPPMYHTVGQKPWKGSALLRALGAVPPSNAIKYFFTQVSSPIRVYPALSLSARRIDCRLAAFIGRFYARR